MDSNTLIASAVGLLFLVTGVQFYRGKWLFLIAGYSTMDKEEKNKVNKPFVGRVMGTMLLLSCLIILTMLVYPKAQTVCLILQVMVIIGGILYANAGNH